MDHYIIPSYRHLVTGNLCSIFNNFSDGLYITDRDGVTIAMNKSYERITGLYCKDLLGRNVADLVKEGVFDEVLNPEIVSTGKSATKIQVNSENRRVLVTGFPVFDYDNDVDLVVTCVRDVTRMSRLEEQVHFQKELVKRYRQQADDACITRRALFPSEKMRTLFEKLERVAQTEATVLLLGPTGVGKDVVARRVHEMSTRDSAPFFKVDCASIPENLIETELFGYASGAFSEDDTTGKAGFFEIAHNGTLFLDEIAELPLFVQAKLLRVFQNGEFCRVGETKLREVNVRIIATSNRNLEEEVKKGFFRSDLYYRLHVAVAHIPALKEREEDILTLTTYFIEKFSHKYKKFVRFSREAEEALLLHSWPGNVRELENLVHSLVVSNIDGIIHLEELPYNIHKNVESASGAQAAGDESQEDSERFSWDDFFEGKSLKYITEYVERKALKDGLSKHDSISSLAKTLQTERSTLSRKLKKYGISAK